MRKVGAYRELDIVSLADFPLMTVLTEEPHQVPQIDAFDLHPFPATIFTRYFTDLSM